MAASIKEIDKKLVFENGRVFEGTGFGADGERVCEVVFNTAMCGYQEIMSDCAYNGQFVCMTYPLIGNSGMAADDYESRSPKIGGLIVREYNDSLSNFRAVKTLAEEMEETGIPGIEGVDTRLIARMIRSEGTMRAIICDIGKNDNEAVEQIKNTPLAAGQVKNVSCKKRWYSRAAGVMYNVAVIDCGVKLSLIESLVKRRCNVTVLPYDTGAEEIFALSPDGIIIAGGPGDPKALPQVAELVNELQGKIPMLGICLGHLIVALAGGCDTYKLKYGHRGINHPVLNLSTGKIAISSQNHSYAVDLESVKNSKLEVSYEDVIDKTVEGLKNERAYVMSVQFHPEGGPGSGDTAYVFDEFIEMIQAFRQKGGFRQTYTSTV